MPKWVPWSTVASSTAMPERAGSALRPRHNRPRPLADLAAMIGTAVSGTAASDAAGSGEAGVAVRGISSSSDQVCPGDLFAALPGARSHGADFAGAAAAAGAVALLTDSAGAAATRELRLPTVVTDDPRAVLGKLSAQVYGNPSHKINVLGITGTSGKTTTTFLVRAGLQAAGLDAGLIGTVGVFLGEDTIKTPFTTPEAPQLQALLAVLAERGIGHLAMEVSSHALRLGRVDGIEFAIAAFTNLSQDHLDFHSDMEDYFQAKAMLFDGRARREIVVLDDDWGRRLVRETTVTVSATGLAADWQASDVTVAADGSTRFIANGPGLRFAAGCRIPGGYNVTNTLLACAILAEAGVDVAAVAPALAQAQVRGRMERVDGDQPFLAVVDYSHKPAGVTGALRALRPLTAKKLIIVLGCGGDRDRSKRAVMGEVAAREADVLVVTDDNPRSEDPAQIRAAMLAGARVVPSELSARILEEGDRRRAIEIAIALAEPGDTILIAGKGHETGQDIGGVMLAFDDVTVLREALLARGFSTHESVSDPNVTRS